MAITHNTINYAYQALFVGPTPATGGHFFSGTTKLAENVGSGNFLKQLHRIQTCNYSSSVNRVNIQQFGQHAAIDRPIIETPTVSLSFSYLLANFWNENVLGFHTSGLYSCVSGLINKSQDDKNYFLKIAEEGVDAILDTRSNSNNYTMGFGNGYITSYATQAAVNGFPSVDVTVEALNWTVDTGISGLIPAIFPDNGARITGYRYLLPTATGSPGTGNMDISVLRPGDITLTIREREADDEGTLENATGPYNTVGVAVDEAHIQGYSLSFSLAREMIQSLGTKFAKTRQIAFPIDIALSVDLLPTRYITGTWSDLVQCDKAYDIVINLKKPVCPGETPQPVICRYIVKNAKLDTSSSNSAIGGNKSASLAFTAQMGGPNESTVGLFMSGLVDPNLS